MPDLQTGTNDYSRATAQVAILIDGKAVNWPLNAFELTQKMFDHQTLKLTFSLDIEGMAGPDSFSRISEYQDTIGKSVTINIEPLDEYVQQQEKLEWFGYVTNVSLANTGVVMNQIVIEAKSPTYFMDHHRKFKTYLDKNFTDVLKSRLSENALDTGGVEAFDSVQRKFQVQWNQTDWDYITSTYKTGSHWIYWDGKKLCVAKAATKGDHSLSWGKNIGSAEIKMNVVQYETELMSWDGLNKEKIGSTKTSSTSYTGLASKAYNASRTKLSGKSALAIEAQPENASDADGQAKTQANAQLCGLVNCKVQSNVPSVKIGDTIVFDGLGSSYAGKYFVTEVHHAMDDGGYFNHITSVPLETANAEWHHEPRQRILDPVPALVTDNDDPDKQGRVKVKFPFLDGSTDIESFWARFVSPNAGNQRGFLFLPEVNDEVLVAFERGDPDRPYVIGALWNAKDKLPVDDAVANGQVNRRIIKSRLGHVIELGDKDGEECIKIIDKTGKNSIIIDTANNTISITAEQDINVTAKGNISLKATGDIKMEGQNVNIDAKTSCKINAGSGGADIESSSMMTLKASANMTVQGAMVDVKGSGPVTVKGMPISLN